jgi:DGQHR domain-containing protein
MEGDGETFLASKTTIDSFTLYHFFAPTDRIVHLCHVRRRMPTGGDLALAYQRILKPKKVSAIRSYLPRKGSFFPNSIILASDHEITWYKNQSDGMNEIGKIMLPNKYGSLNVIDGQHRLYGTESTDLGSRKPVSICLIEGLSKPEEASLFTTINQEQTKVSADLMWDLYGDLGSLTPPPKPDNKLQIDQAIRFLVSNIWKSINESKNHPLRNMIKIPSHHQIDLTFLGFGDPLCIKLEKRKNWDPGYLRPNEGWKNAENFARKRVALFYKLLIEKLSEQWEKPSKRGSKNWLRSSYAFAAIGNVFNFMVEFYGGVPQHKPKWISNEYESLIDKFTGDLSKAIMDEKLGFNRPRKNNSILDAGSNSVRMEYSKELILHMKQNNTGYTELAPLVVEEEEGNYPSDRTRERVEEIESRMRGVIFHAYYRVYGDEWQNNVTSRVKEKFEEYIEMESMYGRDIASGSKELLENTNVADLWSLLEQKRAPPSLFKQSRGDRHSLLSHTKEGYKTFWYDEFRNLRNMIAHLRPYPSTETQQRLNSSLKYIELSLDKAEDSLSKNLEEE